MRPVGVTPSIDELLKLTDKVMNLAVKAYITSDNQKAIIKVRQAQDIFLDKLKVMSSRETFLKLDHEAMRSFYMARLKK